MILINVPPICMQQHDTAIAFSHENILYNFHKL
jgi:hypothetical protein